MILSIHHGSIANIIGEKEAIRAIKNAGFDGVDFSFCGTKYGPIYFDDYIDMAKGFKKLLDEEGIVCTQSHAPFVFSYGMDMSTDNYLFREIVRSLEMAEILGTDKCVVHGVVTPKNVDYYQYNLEYYGKLEKYAKQYGVKILVENLWLPKENPQDKYYPAMFGTPKEMKSFIEEINSPYIKGLVDTGHARLVGTDPAEYIRGLDNKTLLALHVHDNGGLPTNGDDHYTPFVGAIDWNSVMQALADIDYKGDMNLEVINYKRLPKEVVPSWLKFQEQAGRYLIDEFKKCYIKNLQEIERKEAEEKAKLNKAK